MIKYNLTNEMVRDLNKDVECKIRQKASALGLSVHKNHKEFEVKGDATKMEQFKAWLKH